MSSTASLPKVAGLKLLVLGSSGRMATLLRRVWAPNHVTWASRQPGPGKTVVFPLDDTQRLAELAAQHDVILNCAGVPAGRGNIALNTDLAVAAIHAAAHTRQRRVFLCSSLAVYGKGSWAHSETDVPRPVSDYGREKRRMEMAATELGNQLGVHVCNLRIGNVAGADAILGGWQPGFKLDRFADGTHPQRSYLGAPDLALVVETLLRRSAPCPAFLNVALPVVTDMAHLLTAAGLPWRPRSAPSHAIKRAVMDVSLLQDIVALPCPDNVSQYLAQSFPRAHTLRTAA